MRVPCAYSISAMLPVMLTIYRRHLGRCSKRKRVASCSCPVWVQGTLHGQKMRKSLGIRNWESAQKMVREWESRLSGSTSVSQAFDRYLADCVARGLRPETLRKYELLAREMVARFGGQPVDSIGIDALSEYRESWKLSAVTARKKVERLRAFFRFSIERGWIEKNPALLLKHPRTVHRPTLPVEDAEFEKLLEAAARFPKGGTYGDRSGERIKVFLLILRYSGLRIQDAVLLSRDKVVDGRIFLYSQKTNVPVWVPLPEFVIRELEKWDGDYFFWSGRGLVKTAVANWQRSLSRLGRLAGVTFHAHQLRDSFATSLLEKGVPLETVAVLLGNSVKVCERHYAPWIQSRQDRLEEAVKRIWLAR